MPRGRGVAVLAWIELRGNRTTARGLDQHGQEVPEPGAGALPRPHGRGWGEPMSEKAEGGRNLIRQEAADWFVANRVGLTAAQRDSFTAWLQVSPLHVEEYLGLAAIAHRLRRACAASARSVDTVLVSARAPADTQVQPLWPRAIAALRGIPAHRWQTAAVAMAAFG